MINATGFDVRDKLAALPEKVEKRVLGQGLRRGAKIVLAAAKAEAPERSGRVKRNLKIRSGKGGKGRVALTVGVAAKDFKGPAFYAGFLIYGHHTRPQLKTAKGQYGSATEARGGAGQKFVPANDFLERAFNASKEAAAAATGEAWVELIEETK